MATFLVPQNSVLEYPTLNVLAYGAKPDGYVIGLDAYGTDLGAVINALDGYLGSSTGTILVPDGYYRIATQVHLHSNHRLLLGKGIYYSDASLAGPVFLYESNIEISGAGWDTIIREAPNTVFFVFRDYIGSLNNDNVSASNVLFKDFQIQGPYATGFNSAPSALAVGNCTNVTIERIWFNLTKSIGLNIGGTSNTGNHAENVWIKNCLFTGVASQSVGVVNANHVHVLGNTFRQNGQPGGPGCSFLDCETNNFTDTLIDIEIVGNIFDGSDTGNAPGGNAILVQTQDSGTTNWPTNVGPVIISGNTIIGQQTTAGSSGISNGVFLNRAHGTLVSSNMIKRVGQNGVSINACNWCSVTGNFMFNIGGGGIPAMSIAFNSTHNTFKSNTFAFDYEPASGNAAVILQEFDTSDYNYYTDNTAHTNYAPGFADGYIILVGTHSTVTNHIADGYLANYTGICSATSTISSSRALAQSDDIIFVDTTSAGVTLTLFDATIGAYPTQTGKTGRTFKVKRIAGANNVILSPVNSQTINGSASYTISTGTMVEVYSDGSNWWTDI